MDSPSDKCGLLSLSSFTEHAFKGHPITTGINTSLLFMAKQHSTVWTYCILFIHTSADGDLSCLHFLATLTNAVMNIHAHKF